MFSKTISFHLRILNRFKFPLITSLQINLMNSNFGQSTLANFTKIENIGKGTYGQVYKAKDNKTKEIVAIKKIYTLNQLQNEGFPSTSIRQISLLQEIDHKNVIQLKDVIIDQKQLYLVFEYVERDLKSYIDMLGDKMLSSAKIKKIVYQIISGVADCHVKRVIHRDLKPANILVDKNQVIKIADFGLARTYTIPVRPYTQDVVTLWYRAPEILLGSLEYSTPIDIWSIGCIFAEIITKRPLFEGDSDIDQLCRIFKILGTPNDQVWPGVSSLKGYKSTFPNWASVPIQNVINSPNLDPVALDLLSRMLRYDPNQRITAKAALHHPYFKDINIDGH